MSWLLNVFRFATAGTTYKRLLVPVAALVVIETGKAVIVPGVGIVNGA